MPPPTRAMERHNNVVADIATTVQGFFKCGKPYRIFHGSSNSTRPRPDDTHIDISALSNVVHINVHTRTALVEPNVPMDQLIEATLPYGLVPPVVMDFPGITAGGGFAGTSCESSSFRHGFFNDTVNYVEMILGNGELVKASPTERSDLFYGAAGAVGTLGMTTMMELQLVEAQKFVKTTYYRTSTIESAVTQVQAETKDQANDYIDGIVYSPTHGVIITGQLTNHIPAGYQARTFSDAADPWFYLHVQDKTQHLPQGGCVTEYIPLAEYLFRYDRAGFWVGRQGYTYFKYIPFNNFFRWFLDDFSHTRMLYHALHAGGISSRFIVQDLGIPYESAAEFVDYAGGELNVWPLWLCPLKAANTPTFHPVTSDTSSPLIDVDEKREVESAGVSAPMLNVGVWGWGPQEYNEFVSKNRGLETKLRQLGGRKWLYAHTYYSEDEFWKVYDRPWYQSLREKYRATTLPTVFDKVKIDVEGNRPEHLSWKKTLTYAWPIGGVWGMWLAYMSGDYNRHRRAEWKYKGDRVK